MASPLALSLLLFQCLVFSSRLSRVHGGLEYVEANVDILFVSTRTCNNHKDIDIASSGEHVGKSLKVSHRYGPCSPKGGKVKQATFIQQLLRRDVLRVASLNEIVGNSSVASSLAVSLPSRLGATYSTSNYIITVGLGSPTLTQTVIFDTGSTINWVQCQPCPVCHPQAEPIFNPGTSKTYRNISCNTVACNLVSRRGCTSTNVCIYQVLYGDGSTTTGYLAQDNLTLTSTSIFSNFVFGCGQNNQGLFGREAGLFGLSRNALSLSQQIASANGNVFSYCLPSFSSGTGDLTFGPVTSTVSYTPLVTDARAPSLYFLQLTSISVGGVVLPVSSTVFSTAGTLIDSGTVITRLPKTAYAALRTAFRNGMTLYRLTNGVSILDTCYDFRGLSTVSVPSIALTYGGGVTVKLGFYNIMIALDAAHVCLAFAGNSDDVQIGIIGNVQQTSQRVVYDVGTSRIGFGAATCG